MTKASISCRTQRTFQISSSSIGFELLIIFSALETRPFSHHPDLARLILFYSPPLPSAMQTLIQDFTTSSIAARTGFITSSV